MSTSVTTDIRLRGDTSLTEAFAFAEVRRSQGRDVDDPDVDGCIRLGDGVISIMGSAADMRSLAKAIEDGALEVERLDAEARRPAEVPCRDYDRCGNETTTIGDLCFECEDDDR